MRMRLLFSAAVVSTIAITDSSAASAVQDPDSVSRRERVAREADRSYLEGIDAIAGSADATAAFERSAEQWRMLTEDGVDDASVWFNLGNSYLRSGRIGESIVAYRRAQRRDPSSDDIAANLAIARSKIDRPIEADANDLDFGDAAAGWRILSSETRWWIGVAAWIGFWTLLFLRRNRVPAGAEESESRSALWRGGLVSSFILAIVCFATIALDTVVPIWRSVGVVVETDVVVRSGNGDGFEAAIEEPITAGVEFRILEDRPGWWRIELPDGSQGWIAMRDGERI